MQQYEATLRVEIKKLSVEKIFAGFKERGILHLLTKTTAKIVDRVGSDMLTIMRFQFKNGIKKENAKQKGEAYATIEKLGKYDFLVIIKGNKDYIRKEYDAFLRLMNNEAEKLKGNKKVMQLFETLHAKYHGNIFNILKIMGIAINLETEGI